jgi:hypothetical protein
VEPKKAGLRALMVRTTMVCIGPPNQRFQSRLFNLFDQQRLPPLNFISIRLENSIWTKFQVEGGESGRR